VQLAPPLTVVDPVSDTDVGTLAVSVRVAGVLSVDVALEVADSLALDEAEDKAVLGALVLAVGVTVELWELVIELDAVTGCVVLSDVLPDVEAVELPVSEAVENWVADKVLDSDELAVLDTHVVTEVVTLDVADDETDDVADDDALPVAVVLRDVVAVLDAD